MALRRLWLQTQERHSAVRPVRQCIVVFNHLVPRADLRLFPFRPLEVSVKWWKSVATLSSGQCNQL
jgi:hypothetical protein